MKILVIDNYDSFTYNLVQYIEEILDQGITVVRNDEISLLDVENYDTIILSPGPGLPADAGIMPDLIKKYASTKNILGICLGHQAIGEAFGASLKNLSKVFHGIQSPISITASDEPIFQKMPSTVEVGRYHSWVINKNTLSEELEILAHDEDGEIQAIRHKTYNVRGLQFHPESIMTEQGRQMLSNFLTHSKKINSAPLHLSV